MSKTFEVTMRSEFRIRVTANDANEAQHKVLKIIKKNKLVDYAWVVSIEKLK